jgi:hypothetical protein
MEAPEKPVQDGAIFFPAQVQPDAPGHGPGAIVSECCGAEVPDHRLENLTCRLAAEGEGCDALGRLPAGQKFDKPVAENERFARSR